MPQELVAVYEKESGKLHYMHSVDAGEAVRLGDYTYMAPGGKEADADAKAFAMARAKGMSPPGHAELLSPEEREEMRREANEQQVPMVTVPMDQPVVLHSGSPAPVAAPARSPRSQAQADKDDKK